MDEFGDFYESIDDLKRIKFSEDHEPAYTNNMIQETYLLGGKVFVAEKNKK